MWLAANVVASYRRPADTPTAAISSLAPHRASPRPRTPNEINGASAVYTTSLCLIPADETILISSTTKQGTA
jgi:hypothetical protein